MNEANAKDHILYNSSDMKCSEKANLGSLVINWCRQQGWEWALWGLSANGYEGSF